MRERKRDDDSLAVVRMMQLCAEVVVAVWRRMNE